MKAWKYIFQVLKENNCQARLVYPTILSFLSEKHQKNLPQFTETKWIHDHWTSMTENT
jgi:hypothetical protein